MDNEEDVFKAQTDSVGTYGSFSINAADLKPMEVIERGEIDRLWNMVFASTKAVTPRGPQDK